MLNLSKSLPRGADTDKREAKEKPSGFSPERLRRVARMERDHFWFVGRRRAVARWLQSISPINGWVLDAGCGTGVTTQWLTDQGVSAIGLDLLPDGLRALRAQHRVIPLVQGSVERLPFQDRRISAIMFLDVLEHVDDSAALREAARVLKPGGWLIASAPAFPWLRSPRDVAAGHRRRYTRSLLNTRLTECGFRVIAWQYYSVLLFPMIVLTRLLSRLRPRVIDYEEKPGPPLNRCLTVLVQLETALGRWVRWPVGSTLLVLARKEVAGVEV